jgi:hypothetical protein
MKQSRTAVVLRIEDRNKLQRPEAFAWRLLLKQG